jgi:hypothetical protein
MKRKGYDNTSILLELLAIVSFPNPHEACPRTKGGMGIMVFESLLDSRFGEGHRPVDFGKRLIK